MDAKRLREFRNLRFRIMFKGQVRIQGTEEYKNMSAEFLQFANSINDQLQKDVVMLYYYHAKSNIAISEQLHYSETHIKRAKHKAVLGGEGE